LCKKMPTVEVPFKPLDEVIVRSDSSLKAKPRNGQVLGYHWDPKTTHYRFHIMFSDKPGGELVLIERDCIFSTIEDFYKQIRKELNKEIEKLTAALEGAEKIRESLPSEEVVTTPPPYILGHDPGDSQ
jgi:hypothetical protein